MLMDLHKLVTHRPLLFGSAERVIGKLLPNPAVAPPESSVRMLGCEEQSSPQSSSHSPPTTFSINPDKDRLPELRAGTVDAFNQETKKEQCYSTSPSWRRTLFI